MNSQRKIWFTSDYHIGSETTIRYAHRPFRNAEHMRHEIIKRHNSVVKDGDLVYNLGDFGFCSKKLIADTVSQLNGIQILILGNHDKGFNKYLECGFNVVTRGAMIQIHNQMVTISHLPLYGIRREDTSVIVKGNANENWHHEEKFNKEGLVMHDFGQFHLHGHIHSLTNRNRHLDPRDNKVILDRQYDVGVDGNNFMPVSMSQIQSWIMKVIKKGE